ncbi:iron chelate uptake ABC transporter family permease subunit [uncultured Marinobacter sp.]|uniref:iron chelate uptake ABC transporter family permease subunit n=1 Tax=uncultured Marinobacter sp. TaxID=187379 RepID=UPI0032B16172
MYAESTAPSRARPALPARLATATVVLWLTALLATTLPWAGELPLTHLLAAFWTYDPEIYASVLAHFSWAPRVAMAVLIGAAFGVAGAVTQQILGNPLASPTTLGSRLVASLALPSRPCSCRGCWH